MSSVSQANSVELSLGRAEAVRSVPPIQPARRMLAYAIFRRTVDILVALVLLVATAPLSLVAMMLVKLTSRGPALYTQVRVGWKGRLFVIYKIRTMHQDAERDGPRWAMPGDSRITSIGGILRKLHLDELPQLWNVLEGNMTLIGPRPERPEFVPQLCQAIPHYADRLAVRPGVTGFAQVQLPADTDLESVRRKLAYDLYYIRHANLWFDFRLLLATALKVFHVPFPAIRRLMALPTRQQVEAEFARATSIDVATGETSATAITEVAAS